MSFAHVSTTKVYLNQKKHLESLIVVMIKFWFNLVLFKKIEKKNMKTERTQRKFKVINVNTNIIINPIQLVKLSLIDWIVLPRNYHNDNIELYVGYSTNCFEKRMHYFTIIFVLY